LLEALREGIAGRAWFGEVPLRAEDLSEVGFDPGVLGCGIVMCNVGQQALAARFTRVPGETVWKIAMAFE
jgi:hypothetical protein